MKRFLFVVIFFLFSINAWTAVFNEKLTTDEFNQLKNGTLLIKNINFTKNMIATNTNKLRYLDKFDCIWPEKMKICILLFRDGDNWVLYGIGGVNAPRIPFFTERIQTSLINRINTFCSYIFKKF